MQAWSREISSSDIGRLLHRKNSDRVDLQDLVAVVVDDLHGDLAGRRRVEGLAPGTVDRLPQSFVDLGAEGPLELLEGLVGPEEVGVADEEALAVVIGVDEPTGDVVGR